MKHKIIKLVRTILAIIFYFAPIKNNKIVFINFNGRGYGCNPKYIAQEILNQGLPYDLVWLVNNMNEVFPAGIRKVRYGMVQGLYEVATAKIIITNVKNDLFLVKKKNQYIIQTWHGSYSSKLLENEAADKLSPQYLKQSMKNSAQTDLFLSNSKVLSQCYRDAFWCTCEIMECGFPRNDMLFPKDLQGEVRRVKEIIGLAYASRLVLYAPTFRDDGSTDAYGIDSDAILKVLHDVTGDSWQLLIRLHPNVGDASGVFEFGDEVIDVTDYPDMQELLLISDILITDYSSTVFEFAAMEKPSYIFATDVEAYQKMRGLKQDFFQMPYPICRTTQELINHMKNYTEEVGKSSALQFMRFFGGVDKGDASRQVVARIKQKINLCEVK